MADEDVTTENTEDENESPVIRQLRQQLKAKDKELKARDDRLADLEESQRTSVFKEAGFDLKAEDEKAKNRAEAVLKLHEGDLTPEAIKQTAERYGFAEVPQTQVDPLQQQRIAQGNAADQLLSTSQQPSPPPDLDQRIAEAEANGDVATTISLKMERASARA